MTTFTFDSKDPQGLLCVLGEASIEFDNAGAPLSKALIDELRDQLRPQVEPAIKEPELDFSVVNARPAYTDTVTSLTKLGGRWLDVDGNDVGQFDTLSDVEVLRVGIGEPEPTPAEIEQVIRDVTEKARGDHDIAELTAREVVGRLVQRLPATMFRTRDVDIEPDPVRVRRFCSLRRDCRMADGHDGGCKP